MKRQIDESDIAGLYHLNSSNFRSRPPDLSVDDDRRPSRFRTFPGAERLPLTGCDLEVPAPLGETLERRASERVFAGRSMPREFLGKLLFGAYGIRGAKPVNGGTVWDRPAPSAGGLYPLEFYAVTQQVEDLPNGVFHFDPLARELEVISHRAVSSELASLTIGQEMLADANAVLVIAADFARTMWKYGQRGYRYVWLDAGHAAQNVYLLATALGLAVVSVGGFYDQAVGELIGLPDEERAIYLVCAGLPERAESSVEDLTGSKSASG
jgi:SagB-type dehydrogenase family enzyme